MKRYLILALALALVQIVRAEFVKPEAATRYAQGFLGMSEAPAPENTAQMRAPSRGGANSAPDYYVFNNPGGGWVIIAADDRVNPIIGYSDQGTFSTTGMPDNLRWWMDGVSEIINGVRESGTEASASVRAAWASLQAGANPIVNDKGKYLPTAQWSQSEPYNDLCPIVKGENVRSATGCVATAMGIIMQYNQWPARGKGVIGGYTTASTQTYIKPYDISMHSYDWSLMSQSLVTNGSTWHWNTAQKQEVATVLHDCGVSVKMDYSSQGSSASSGSMLKAMKDNFSYSEQAVLVSRSSYTTDKWMSLIQTEIDNGRVVFYAGLDESGGHAFVCDGYSINRDDIEASQLHINWGWGGDCNGFYPLDLAITQLNFRFSDMQEAVIGLAPDTVDVQMEETISLVCVPHAGFYGIEPLTPADLTSGSEFKFYVGWMMNNSSNAISAEFKICLEDKDGHIMQDGWHLKMNIPGSNDYIYSDETEASMLVSSPRITDRFRLYIKNSKEEWVPMNGNYDLLPGVDGVICGVIQDPVIIVPDNCTAGQEIDLRLSLGFTHVRTLRWSVNGTPLEDSRVTLVQGDNAIRADVEYLDGTTGSIFRTLHME